ncbi:MAG: SOS response-associated peptidase family protein [Williamsia sp.]|nr:SOS response-associated peptidase family protein [Williamsia sp.]
MQHEVSFATDFKTLINYFPESEADGHLLKNLFSDRSAKMGDGSMQPVISLNPVTGGLVWHAMAWGCMPFDLADAVIPGKQWAFMLYTSAERIFGDTECYWHKIRDQRCLVPASGIYVHRTVRDWRRKVPYFVHIPDQPIFFLPGLYSADEAISITTGQKVVRWVFTIIGRSVNGLVKQLATVHEKNYTTPLLLPFSLARHWLDHDLTEADYRSILEFDMPPEALQAWPIYSTQPHEQRPDNKEKNERFDWKNLPPLKV